MVRRACDIRACWRRRHSCFLAACFSANSKADVTLDHTSCSSPVPGYEKVHCEAAAMLSNGMRMVSLGQALKMVALPMDAVKHSYSATTMAASENTFSDDSSDMADVTDCQSQGSTTPLSASASRRRRRQKISLYAAEKEGMPDGKANHVDEVDGRISNASEKPDVDQGRPLHFASTGKDRSSTPSCTPQMCAELSAQLARGGRSLANALRAIIESACTLSVDFAGCRVVQDALQLGDEEERAAIAKELRGNIYTTAVSPHGNFVIQKMIEILPNDVVSFMSEELKSRAAETARHRYGCRVVCRLLEHAGSSSFTVALIDAVLMHVADLCAHNYGHHVMESVLIHGQPNQKSFIVRTLCSKASRYTVDRNATHVIKTALVNVSEADRKMLLDELNKKVDRLLTCAENQYGHYVVRAVLKLPAEASFNTRAILMRFAPRLRYSSFGSRILEDLQM
eukprot:TRINITY_DN5104_c0_g2_i2.p1 TRINITY_DN5104_c0_g2~~TRINITY_DN5104_c0_g2_i2.p1  ORF type:complete len:454 (+),score=70.67 TRINITY_DN5104_c0_g2_i2:211-1572(+)